MFQSIQRYFFSILFLLCLSGLYELRLTSVNLAYAKNDTNSVELNSNSKNKIQLDLVGELLLQAEFLREQGAFLRAQKLLTSGLQNRPDNFQIRLKLAQLLRTMGYIVRAESLYRELHAQEPNNPQPLIALSQIALERLELSNALKYSRQAVLVAPNNSSAHLSLAAALIANDALNEADAELRQHHDNYTLNADRLYLIYQLDLKENKPDLALAALRQAIQLKPSNSLWLMDLSYLYRQIGDYDNALRALHFYIYANPLSIDAWSKVASLYEFNFHNYDQATRAYREILKLDPDVVDATVGIDRCKLKSNDLAAALKDQLWKFLRQSKTFGNFSQEQDKSPKVSPFLRRTRQ